MKKIILGIIILSVTLSFKADNGKLAGIITFKDSHETSNKPDAGCEIYIINQADVQPTPYYFFPVNINNFQMIKSDYSIAASDMIDPYRIKKAKDLYDTVSGVTSKLIEGFKKLPGVKKYMTDEKGKYSINLRPGKYYLLFVSGTIKSNNMAEIKGNVDAKEVVVNSGGETILNYTFEKQPMIWIKRIEASQRIGC
jgi:hypothetical protein